MDWDMPELNRELAERIIERSNVIVGNEGYCKIHKAGRGLEDTTRLGKDN
jgi:hypothetical protein